MDAPAPPPAAQQLSFNEAALTLFKASIGPGCLSYAFAVSCAGLAVALPELAVLTATAVYCMHLIVSTKQALAAKLATAGVRTYGDIGAAVGGLGARRLIETCLVFQQLGVCCVFFSFIATNLDAFMAHAGISNALTRSFPLLVFAAYPLLASLAQIRQLKTLAPLNMVANVLMLAGFAIVLVVVRDANPGGPGVSHPARPPWPDDSIGFLPAPH
jgi:amino acid permease